jgi:hypothetical protein
MSRTWSATAGAGTRRRSSRWTRDMIVGSTFCGSVVAIVNTTWSGGSSISFSSALNAAVEAMCTSSRM